MNPLASWDNSLWLIEPQRAGFLAAQFSRLRELPGARVVALERRRRLEEARAAAGRAVRAVKGKVGVIAIHGPIEQRLCASGLEMGGCSCEEVAAQLDALLDARDVQAIVMHIDSPGGSVYGTEELADKIFQARGQKPLYAIADALAASAAYWIASAAEHLSCTPSGEVGSVGVYFLHVDQSAQLEQDGLKATFISAGKFKVEANPLEPLSEEGRTDLQAKANATYDKFTAALARNRGVAPSVVRASYGQGRVLDSGPALAAGMVDKICSFEDLMDKLTGGAAAGGSARAASQTMLRLRQQQRQRLSAHLGGQAAPARQAGAGMEHDDETHPNEPDWDDVDPAQLPRQAFADQGVPNKPETYQYPHHWVKDGGKPDAQGRFTTGTLFLHAGGLEQACAGAQMDSAPPKVQGHLDAHKKTMLSEQDLAESQGE